MSLERVRRLELTVAPSDAGVRVELLLRRQFGLSGTVIRRIKWLEDGILLDGVRVNTRCVPQAGQVLSVRLSDPERRSGVVPAPGELDIRYEDGDMVVLNKAPGVTVHPGPGHFYDTVGNFLLWHYDQEGSEADFHPVHRLDRGTSGLMVVAKHPHAQEKLKEQLHTADFFREYLAVCDGCPQPPGRSHRRAPWTQAGVIGGADGPPGRQARPHPVWGGAGAGGAQPAPSGPGHRPHPSDPGPHGQPGLSPHRGFSLWDRGPGADPPARPPLRPPVLPPPHHWQAIKLYPTHTL